MLRKRKFIFTLLLFSCIFICMSFASANNITDDDSYNSNYNESNVVDSPSKSFTDLNNLINDDLNKSEIILEDNYINQDVYEEPYYEHYGEFAEGIFINRSLTIDGQGHVIDANKSSRIFYINANNVTLKNITFKNGYSIVGGAISCNAPNITIINCNFINDEAISGGAISCNAPNIIFINSTFINNTASFSGGAIFCHAPNIIFVNSTFINNFDLNSCGAAIYYAYNGTIINSIFINNYLQERGAAIYYYDTTFNVINESIEYAINCDKIYQIVHFYENYNVTVINSTFRNMPVNEIHYDRPLVIINGEDNSTNNTTNSTNNMDLNKTTENNTEPINENNTNNENMNKTNEDSELVIPVPVNFDVDNNMSQITPTITIIANNTYAINSADDIIEIGFKTNIKNKMFWVEILGLISKTNVTSNDDFYTSIKLSNITKEKEYTILCGFNDYIKPVVAGTDDIIGVADKKTIQINYNNTINNQSTAENNTNPTNTNTNKTIGNNTENDINNTSVPSNSDIGNDNKNQTSTKQVKKQNKPITLKIVIVKKSAKKLILQAVLKQKNKALSGKKVTFKFNGKTYKATTNKNGIAKVTIKKNILKKLKRGKKVKCQVSYGKTVSKKNLIVK